MDINPATRGHVLVIPREHAADLLEIADEDLAACRGRAAARRSGRRTSSGPTASTCSTRAGATAWQTVFHFHVHVIPRYDGDPLRLPWVPEPGDRDEIAAAAAALTG